MSVATEYAFSNSAPQARAQLDTLQQYLDPITVSCFTEIGIGAGARCLELGPGGGSIAAWLVDRTGPTVQVVAVDSDPSQLPQIPELEVVEHDLQRGLPVPGPFDLIHARLVLVHLPNRRELLSQLVAALAPGGWLVLGEFSGAPLSVLTAADEDDAVLFTRVIEVLSDLLVRHGVDFGWAHQAHRALAGAGLARVKTVEHAESWTGGDGGQLHIANVSYLADQLVEAGLARSELRRFRELMADPRFAARSWQFVCTRGQKLA
jgi:SAM-dependent methyltransferase